MKKTMLLRIFFLIMYIMFVACDSKTIVTDVKNQTEQTGVAVIKSPKPVEISGINNNIIARYKLIKGNTKMP